MGISVVDMGQVLVSVVKQAVSQGRITFGVFECAEVLETCPEQVMLCILPQVSSADLLLNIQHKLIEAHCWETGVHLIKVDSAEKMAALLSASEPSGSAMKVARTLDFTCMLIGYPCDDMSDEDCQIMKQHSYLFHETAPDCTITLPD